MGAIAAWHPEYTDHTGRASMRAKEIESLAKSYLPPHLPGFNVKGQQIYATPVNYFLRGFAFETSAYERAIFNVSVFVQPLYIPSQYAWFNLGDRLGALGGHPRRWWNIDDGIHETAQDLLRYIQAEGIPFLDKIHTPRDFVKKLHELTSAPDEPVVKQAWCYALVLAGEYEGVNRTGASVQIHR